jgi:hypothetical protein
LPSELLLSKRKLQTSQIEKSGSLKPLLMERSIAVRPLLEFYIPVLACSYPTPAGITVNIDWSGGSAEAMKRVTFDVSPLDNVFPLVDTVTASLI